MATDENELIPIMRASNQASTGFHGWPIQQRECGQMVECNGTGKCEERREIEWFLFEFGDEVLFLLGVSCTYQMCLLPEVGWVQSRHCHLLKRCPCMCLCIPNSTTNACQFPAPLKS